MQPTRQFNLTSIRRDAWIEVDLTSLEHNLKVLRLGLAAANAKAEEAKGQHPHGPALMAVVKSDAYGHGAVALAQLFAAIAVDYLGVASVDEGCQIRDAGVNLPILILSPTPSWAIASALEYALDITVSTEKQLLDIGEKAKSMDLTANIHLKVDTGMHRLGVSIDRLPKILDSLRQFEASGAIRLVSVYSHLANAADESKVLEQKHIFDQAVQLTRPLFPKTTYHFASSEAATRFPSCHYDMVRIGLYLYGLEPNTVSRDLQPVLAVRARINHISRIEAGERVGYGHTWQAMRTTKLAAIPIGYADGVDRGLSNHMKGLIMGQKIDQVGRISMDQMLFDITDVPQAEEGDVITLIGNDGQNTLYLSEWAVHLDTITYELACRLRARLPRVYTRHK
ncbi:MAG: alanine racemase [Cyanobacteria bacterium REEB67]|nr:alanine racemase [Cyanobacteria bacterium REEB67]